MKANRGLRIHPVFAAAAIALLTTSCVERRAPPAPAPAPAPIARPTPPPPLPPRLDWRDMPITPGDWRWSMEGGQSVARFADGALVLRCDPGSRLVTIQRKGAGVGQVPMTVITSEGSRQLTASAQHGPPPALTLSIAGRDRLLDAIAFSRGRFAVETAGLPTLYVPSWPEISRVIEDCR